MLLPVLRKRTLNRRDRLLLLILPAALLPAATEIVRAQNDTTCNASFQWKPVSTWAELQTAMNNDACIRLNNNITAGDGDSYLDIHKTVTLDLNGKTLNRGLQNKEPVAHGCVIRVSENGNLMLTGSGKITGGNNMFPGGGVFVWEYGNLTVSGNVVITGNEAESGGGVSVLGGTFTMNSGTISGNCFLLLRCDNHRLKVMLKLHI